MNFDYEECLRVINREYMLSKNILYIGRITTDNYISIFQKAFQKTDISTNIEYILKNINIYDIVVILAEKSYFDYSKKIRCENPNIPIIILHTLEDKKSPIDYLKLNLSHFVETEITDTEMMYIIQNHIEIYDNFKKKEKLLSENKTYLELLDKLVIVSKADLKGKVTYANDIFCDISKYTKEELLGSNHNILRHPDVSKNTFKEMWETIKKDDIWHGTLKNKDKDGNTYITKSTISPYFHNGEKKGYVGLRYLVTDEINQKRELKSYLTKKIMEHTVETSKLKGIIEDLEKELSDLKKELKQYILFDKSATGLAGKLEHAKIEKLELQIIRYEDLLKSKTIEHQKRVDNYLLEKRTFAKTLEEKNTTIEQLKKSLSEAEEEIVSFKTAIIKLNKNNKLLNQKVIDLSDVLEHREDQLLKLKK